MKLAHNSSPKPWAPCLLALLLASISTPALAQSDEGSEPKGISEQVSLQIPECEGILRKKLDAILNVELTGSTIPATENFDGLLVEITCADPKKIIVLVRDAKTGSKSLKTPVDLSRQDPRGAERLLALAITESVEAARLEFAPRKKKDPPEEEIVIPPEPDPLPKPAPPRFVALHTGLAYTALPQQPQDTDALRGLGAQLGLELQLWRPIDLQMILRWTQPQARQLSLGEVTTQLYSAALFVPLRLDITDFLTFSAGAGLRIGLLNAQAIATDPTTTEENPIRWMPFAGPALVANVWLRLLGGLSLHLGAEAGYITQSLVLEDAFGRATLIKGATITGELGLGWRF